MCLGRNLDFKVHERNSKCFKGFFSIGMQEDGSSGQSAPYQIFTTKPLNTQAL